MATIIYTVCAIAGRAHLLTIFLNFLALIGYWVIIWIAIVLEDEFIFRRGTGFNWDDWRDQKKLPVGVAAFTSFLIGWAGAIVCMGQTYYYGPIAKLVGDYGADVSARSFLDFCVVNVLIFGKTAGTSCGLCLDCFIVRPFATARDQDPGAVALGLW